MQVSKHMALNARVPAALKRKLDIIAAQQGISKQDAVVQALELWLKAREPKDRRRRLRLPVIRTGRPATLDLTNEKIDEILFG
jgi:predicted transcriptional regulator